MPNFIMPPASTYLGAYNPNVNGFISIDLAVQNNDITFDPANNIQNVTGNQKLAQDIMLFLLSPVGSSLIDGTWGNKALALLGEAISYKGQVEGLISGAVADLQRFKQNEQILRGRLLEASELIQSIDAITINPTGPTLNDIQISIEITTVKGDSTLVNIPLTSPVFIQ